MKTRATILMASTCVLLALPAVAQNRSQIASVKAGRNCPECNLFQADFSGIERTAINLSSARLRQADLSLSTLNRAQLQRADLRDVNAYGAVLGQADLSDADLTNASFVGVWMQGANLSRAKLVGTNLAGSDLRRARGLTQEQLDRACGDENTRLPSGLGIGRCEP